MNLSNYQHVIWDWNGTLLDDSWLCIEVMNGSLGSRDLPLLTPERYANVFVFPVIDFYRRLGFDFSVEPFESLSDEFIEGYNGRLGECGLRSGARETMQRFREMGFSQSILSAMKQDTLDGMVGTLGLRDFFTDVVGLNDHHAHGKVETGRRWLESAGVDPTRALFIGDTEHDHEVAEALGVDCVYIYSGHNDRARLEKAGLPVLDYLSDLFAGD